MNKKIKIVLWAIFGVAVTLGICGVFDASSILDCILGVGGGMTLAVGAGVVVGDLADGPATVEKAQNEVETDYTKTDWNKKLVLVMPNLHVIDTLTRSLGNTQNVKSIKTGGWEIASRDILDKVLSDVTADVTDGVYDIKVGKPLIWNKGDTMEIFSTSDGTTKKYSFYVEERKNTGTSAENLTVRLIGVEPSEKAPALTAEDSVIIRHARAMSEIDAQTSPAYQTPDNRYNYCQIHMAQIEESVIHNLHLKEVPFDFTTMKEQAMFEFRRDMELTNLFGVRDSFVNNNGERIYTSAGLFNQIDRKWSRTGSGSYTLADWVAFTKFVFEGNNGSDRRVCLIGADMMEKWSSVDAVNKQFIMQNVETIHGIRFNKIVTNFGELLVKSASGVMVGPYSNMGLVIDPSYIRKDVYEPLHVDSLDLDKTGQRRVKAQRIIENYCLFVENQPVHCIVEG